MLIICFSIDLNLPAQARVLVIGRTTAVAPYTSGQEAAGSCELGSSVLDLPETFTSMRIKDPTVDNVTLVGITQPLGPGTVQFRIRCNESDADIFYTRPRIAAVALSPS